MIRVRVGLFSDGEVASSVHRPKLLTRCSNLFEIVAITNLNLQTTYALADCFAISQENFN